MGGGGGGGRRRQRQASLPPPTVPCVVVGQSQRETQAEMRRVSGKSCRLFTRRVRPSLGDVVPTHRTCRPRAVRISKVPTAGIAFLFVFNRKDEFQCRKKYRQQLRRRPIT